MTKKIPNFFCSGHVTKNMPNKKNKETEFFTSSEDRMYITVSGIIVFGIKWKTNLFVIMQKKSDQNNYPIKKSSTFCKGKEKWEISQTTVKDKTSA